MLPLLRAFAASLSGGMYIADIGTVNTRHLHSIHSSMVTHLGNYFSNPSDGLLKVSVIVASLDIHCDEGCRV